MNLTHEQKGFTFDKVSQDAYEEWNNKLSRIQVEGGRLPKWELSGMETDVMVGDPAVIVIADTYIRGIRDFDVALAYEAMKENATTLIPLTQPGYNEHIQKGYIPELRENEQREDPWVWGSVSTGLEYCMADFAMSQMALALNKESDYQLFYNYSQLYRNYFGNDHKGIMGNDDCGTMSAWLVYSMMGLYPDCPAKDTYQLTSPLFDRITIKLHQKYYKGDKFIITAGENADEKNFIDEIRINGKMNKKYFITNDQITNGGILTFSFK